MLTDEDIKKLISVFVTKEDLKDTVSALATKTDMNNLLTAIDAYAKKANIYGTELTAMKSAINRHEDWIKNRS